MSATKALTTNHMLVQTVTNAAIDAMKLGMTKDEVSAVLARIQEMLDGADE